MSIIEWMIIFPNLLTLLFKFRTVTKLFSSGESQMYDFTASEFVLNLPLVQREFSTLSEFSFPLNPTITPHPAHFCDAFDAP